MGGRIACMSWMAGYIAEWPGPADPTPPNLVRAAVQKGAGFHGGKEVRGALYQIAWDALSAVWVGRAGRNDIDMAAQATD